jgi:hypothetical protein
MTAADSDPAPAKAGGHRALRVAVALAAVVALFIGLAAHLARVGIGAGIGGAAPHGHVRSPALSSSRLTRDAVRK